MLRTMKSIQGYKLRAIDGDFGTVKEFYFDDHEWTVRYVVADTGRWLPGRRVLLSPLSLGEPDWDGRVLPVALTQEQIEHSPSIDADQPVSRQYEIEFYGYYGLGPYWTAHAPAPIKAGEAMRSKSGDGTGAAVAAGVDSDVHLRSSAEVAGYDIKATDDEIGHVEDFIVQCDSWTIKYLVVDTHRWLPGKKVLVSPEWIDSVDWAERTVSVDLTREQVKGSPEFDPKAPINREYEAQLYDYYGRPHYW